MVNLFPTILYSCMIGITLFALFDVLQRPKNRQSLFLKALLLLLLIHLGGELFIYSGAYVYAPYLAGAQFPFRVLLGPVLYYYAYESMSLEKVIDKKVAVITLLGPILVLLVMSPFIFLISSEEKLALASPETRDPELWKIALFTCTATTLLFISYTIVFLGMALRLHNSHHQQLKERFSNIEQKSLEWFKPILIVWGMVWLMYAVEFFLNALKLRWFGSGVALPVIEVIALATFIQKALHQKILTQSDKGVPHSNKSRTALISSEKMQLISSKLERIMKEDKLFLDENLSLNKLSESIAETENHISETLSQYLNTNFFQYVNSFRIEEAKLALKNKDKLITTIAFEVGFNSKTTFNTAFKRIVGNSPTAYRNSI
ncbi:helix-turn-helix domain-containing protein [Litorilituus lipolyticus]|uniref:AraC family transcriptional regulator n=1 Tax=Litorilituus lipolyticus TaxID=2491017 RepID=A0A502KRZ9_9GAMM|nr:AraC family transcriptional regulator [Litorilituus lipolyticus]TPH13974.1 AraC family transcriptional regulator [Litorilituus lipolyticus]